MKKKGFTLIELLVVIAIIAMLLAILMPALNKVKKIAQRVVCGTNLKGLGTAQTVYSNDYDDQYAVQGGGAAHTWALDTAQWQLPGKLWATPANITVGASLYLLVREADVSPKSFICPSGAESAFEGKNALQLDITELWDFGNIGWGDTAQNPAQCVSYSYQNPYNGTASTGSAGRNAPDGSRSASFAMMADRNPFIDEKLTNGGLAADASNYLDVASWINGNTAVPPGGYDKVEKKFVMVANAQPHDREGQNVLFGDGHSAHEKRCDVGVKHDNIYTPWTSTTPTEDGIRKGGWPGTGSVDQVFVPKGQNDSVLVNDGTGRLMTLK